MAEWIIRQIRRGMRMERLSLIKLNRITTVAIWSVVERQRGVVSSKISRQNKSLVCEIGSGLINCYAIIYKLLTDLKQNV